MARSPSFTRNRTLADLISDTRKPKHEADTAYYKIGASEAYQISFENDWVNSGGTDQDDAQWYLDEGGETRIKGVVSGGSVGTVMFTMPEENRPRGVQTFVCAIVGASGGFASVAVYPDGSVKLESIN